MHKSWKKRLRVAIKDIKTNVLLHGLILGFSCLLINTDELWVFWFSMIFGLSVLYAVYIKEICFAKNSMYDEEGKMEETFGVHALLYPVSRKKEESLDIFSTIHTLLEEHEDDMTMHDTIFIRELKELLQIINYYIKEEGILSEIEEAEALLEFPIHWHDALQTYFAIFPTNRKELADELFLKTKEQREHVEKKYIRPHQNKLIQQCKQKVDCIELKKREYLYMED